jgi:hypothetical protein
MITCICIDLLTRNIIVFEYSSYLLLLLLPLLLLFLFIRIWFLFGIYTRIWFGMTSTERI